MSEQKSPSLTVKSDLFLKENFQLLEPNCTDDVDLDHDSVDIFQNGFWENIMSKSSPTKPNLPDIHVDSDLTTKSNIIPTQESKEPSNNISEKGDKIENNSHEEISEPNGSNSIKKQPLKKISQPGEHSVHFKISNILIFCKIHVLEQLCGFPFQMHLERDFLQSCNQLQDITFRKV